MLTTPRVSHLTLLSLLLTTALVSLPVQANEHQQATQTDLGLSDYHRFIIFPHFEKALRAQKNNDEKTALSEFEYMHQQFPDNIAITLYLSESYRHFGHHDKALQLLRQQLKKAPNNTQLQSAYAAIPVEITPINNLEELLAQERQCHSQPDPLCRSRIGQSALNLAKLDIAARQLTGSFADSPQGTTLREAILQRAVYLKQWQYADEMLMQLHQQHTLSAQQAQQWFDILLAAQRDDRLLALQSQGLINSPEQQIGYANSLIARNETAKLQNYLANRHPSFANAAQEKSWLYLLTRYSKNPAQSLSQFKAQFPQNQHYQNGFELADALKAKDYATAQRLLATLPENEWLEERFTVSLAQGNTTQSRQLAQRLSAQQPKNMALLDRLSYQLMRAGQNKTAAQLLLSSYPFSASTIASQNLNTRLFGLLTRYPELTSPEQIAKLSRPLSTPSQREIQAAWLAPNGQCADIQRLLGDMSTSYSANSWNLLANCYQKTLPGLALYAYQQSAQRQPSTNALRAVAYQAYQTEDYATAVRTWADLSPATLSDQDIMAAANSAQAAGNQTALQSWLAQAQSRNLTHSEAYWWLHAQRFIPNDPDAALADLNRANHIQPSARVYAARANIYRQRGEYAQAITELQQALKLEPNNSDIQANLGYTLWDNGDVAPAREMLQQANQTTPDDPALLKQLTYVNQRLADIPQTRHYAERVIDDIDNASALQPMNEQTNQQRFNFRRLHEDVSRRWTFNFDTVLGLRSGAVNSANNNVGGQPGQSYRSFGQLEAEYRIGSNMLLEGDQLSAYSRVFTGTGTSGVFIPSKDPMWGTGIRWKPLSSQVFFLALEQQIPLDRHHGESDVMIRASSSFLNSGKFSDAWHPNGNGWLAQNLYLDAAHYIRQDNQAYTADYRISWHQKIAANQTIEPYSHVQYNGFNGDSFQGAQLAGIGVRWNIWTGESHYDAWQHRMSIGLEYQNTFKGINQHIGERNSAFITLGVHW
ncbi:NfrA family protein [Pragia fontium]|uniref:NfrA family protein n=1 Tax=Pragia fontium TaxID=82985 RepID=UPI000F6E3517|nr:tetratricopeptide repeat protein [Pragia fontium]VEJ56545.1 bacteriophage N4 receptor, outer membrane subunit [Pragia fontium]